MVRIVYPYAKISTTSLTRSSKPAYAALSVQTREFVIINMWAGQFLCEGFNWVLKRVIRQDRPTGTYMDNNIRMSCLVVQSVA
jgi:hypothetical protein